MEELILTLENGTTSSCLVPGRNVTLTCVTKGYPRPMIIFKKDDQEILSGFNRITRLYFDQVLYLVHTIPGSYLA